MPCTTVTPVTPGMPRSAAPLPRARGLARSPARARESRASTCEQTRGREAEVLRLHALRDFARTDPAPTSEHHGQRDLHREQDVLKHHSSRRPVAAPGAQLDRQVASRRAARSGRVSPATPPRTPRRTTTSSTLGSMSAQRRAAFGSNVTRTMSANQRASTQSQRAPRERKQKALHQRSGERAATGRAPSVMRTATSRRRFAARSSSNVPTFAVAMSSTTSGHAGQPQRDPSLGCRAR